jgi:PAS domain S-box-containing protein/putative nucleotidyltransferase with HDIG domain
VDDKTRHQEKPGHEVASGLFAAALDTVCAIVVIVTPEGKIIYVNQACAEASLRADDEMIGHSLSEFLVIAKGQNADELPRRVLDGGALHRTEAAWVSKYDVRRLIDWSINPIILDQGRETYVVFTGIDITGQKRAEEIIERDAAEIHDVLANSVSAFALTVEARDPYTAGHQTRVAKLAAAIAEDLGLSPDQIEGIVFGAMIHDIGKIYVPSEILNRPGRLSRQEFNIITAHPGVGFDIVKGLAFPWPIREMIHQHHERIDGSGYPQGLKGNEIAIESRVISVADVVEAVSSHRPYRASLGIEKGLEVLKEGRGSHFDPAVVDACMRLFHEKRFQWKDT